MLVVFGPILFFLAFECYRWQSRRLILRRETGRNPPHSWPIHVEGVVAVTLQEADLGDTTTIRETLAEAGETVAELIGHEAEVAPEETPQVNLGGIEEVVADKGYHSGPVLEELKATGVRTYIPEKKQNGQRHWVKKASRRPSTRTDSGWNGPRESGCCAGGAS